MKIEEIIRNLQKLSVKALVEGDSLKLQVPDEVILSEEIISALKSSKAELISFLRHAELTAENARGQEEIPTAPVQKDYPLSSSQMRLWLLDFLNDELIAYNISGAYILKGDINVDAIEQSFKFLLARHEILRTTFKHIDGDPRQVIAPIGSLNFKIGYEDYRSIEYTESELNKIVQKEAYSPFDLSQGPLFRVRVLQLSNREYLMLFTIHHIICDGWSNDILVNEILICYDSFCKSEKPNFDPLKVQYKDYVMWKEGQFNGKKYGKLRAYWTSLLSGNLPKTNLPVSKLRKPLQTFKGKSFNFRIDKSQTEELKKLANSYHASLFSMILSVVNLLFYKINNKTDLVFGTDSSGRSHQDIENNIGFYLDAFVLRYQFDSNINFDELIRITRDRTYEIFDHQDYPLHAICNDLDLKRDLSRNPIFDILVLMQNFKDRKLDQFLSIGHIESDVEVELFQRETRSTTVDIEMTFTEFYDEIILSITYNTDLYYFKDINRLGNSFTRLVDQIIEDRTKSIDQYHLISEKQKKKILRFSKGPIKMIKKGNETVIHSIRRSFQKYKNRTAISTIGQEISYGQLKVKVDTLTFQLQSRFGVSLGDKVIVFSDRSAHSIVSLLAIWQLGAVYVPVDASTPYERIVSTISMSQADVMVYDNMDDTLLPLLIPHIQLLSCERLLAKRYDWDELGNGIEVSPEDLAYIMFTSGSTGNPKGVKITQGSITDYVRTFIGEFAINKSDIVMHQASVAFDTSLEEILPALVSGAGIRIFKEGGKDIKGLIQDTKDGGATILSTTPHVIKELDKAASNITDQLRLIISGGDRLNGDFIQNLLKTKIKLYNTYGPTETTVCVAYHEINSAKSAHFLGKPNPNHQLFVLDENMNLVDVGVIGQIYIGGKGLTSGYLNDLFLEKFVLTSVNDGKLLYSSGDLGRWNAKGQLEFMGRDESDFIKIRGYRVALSEIKRTICEFLAVEDIHLSISYQNQIVDSINAYIVTDEPFNILELRENLIRKLPAYMVPKYLISVKEIVRNHNGKVDEMRLPEPTEQHKASDQQNLTEFQKSVLAIWAEAFDMPDLICGEDFFELGGNSMNGIRIIQLLNEKYDTALSFTDLMMNPTVKGIATLIEESKELKTIVEDVE